MAEFHGIHEELHRLVLRHRWVKWSLRNVKPGDYSLDGGRHIRLSLRLTAFKPTWYERNEEEFGEMET